MSELVDQGLEPNFTDLLRFVERMASMMSTEYGQAASEAGRQNRQQERAHKISAISSHSRAMCNLCEGEHRLQTCPKFVSLGIQDRWRLIKGRGLCFSCLGSGHISSGCKRATTCTKTGCSLRHHPLLHVDRVKSPDMNIEGSQVFASKRATNVVGLGFVPVRLSGPKGSIATYAFLDNDSDCTVVKSDIAKIIGLEWKLCRGAITTLHGTKALPYGAASLTLSSLQGDFSVEADPVVILDRLPVEEANVWSDSVRTLPHLSDINLPHLERKEVGILIGCDVPEAHCCNDCRLGTGKQDFVVKSPFSWVIRGPIGWSGLTKLSVNSLTSSLSAHDLVTQLYEREFDTADDDERSPFLGDDIALERVERSA